MNRKVRGVSFRSGPEVKTTCGSGTESGGASFRSGPESGRSSFGWTARKWKASYQQ